MEKIDMDQNNELEKCRVNFSRRGKRDVVSLNQQLKRSTKCR